MSIYRQSRLSVLGTVLIKPRGIEFVDIDDRLRRVVGQVAVNGDDFRTGTFRLRCHDGIDGVERGSLRWQVVGDCSGEFGRLFRDRTDVRPGDFLPCFFDSRIGRICTAEQILDVGRGGQYELLVAVFEQILLDGRVALPIFDENVGSAVSRPISALMKHRDHHSHSSWCATVVRMSDYRDASIVVAVYGRLRAALTPAEGSWTGHTLAALTAAMGTAMGTSTLHRVAVRIAHWIHNSFLYRWFTAEPESRTIVIDLRDTYTVGPLLEVLDRAIRPLVSLWQATGTNSLVQRTHDTLRGYPIRTLSIVGLAALLTELALSFAFGELTTIAVTVRVLFITLAGIGTRITVSWEHCTESATYRALVAALEPPEQPETGELRDENETE